MIALYVILGVVVLLGLWLMSSYNKLIRLREMVKNAMGQIAANVESRWDALKSLMIICLLKLYQDLLLWLKHILI